MNRIQFEADLPKRVATSLGVRNVEWVRQLDDGYVAEVNGKALQLANPDRGTSCGVQDVEHLFRTVYPTLDQALADLGWRVL